MKVSGFSKNREPNDNLSEDNELEDKRILDWLGIADWNTLGGSNAFKVKELLDSVDFTAKKFYNKFWVRPFDNPTGLRMYYFYKKDIEKVYNGNNILRWMRSL